MNRELYRYVSFEDFINLVINNKVRFVRPSSWKDEYEGYLFSHMETPEDVCYIVKKMYCMFDKLFKDDYNEISDNYFKMWHSKWFTYAQCWSKHSETDAMWKCYSYGDRAIRLRTNEDKLLAHTKKNFKEDEFVVYLKEVNISVQGATNDIKKCFRYAEWKSQIFHSIFTYSLVALIDEIKPSVAFLLSSKLIFSQSSR